MKVLQAASILALAATPISASAAPPFVHPFAPPPFIHPFAVHHGGTPRPVFWRHAGGDGGFERRHAGGDGGFERRHHHGFFGPVGPVFATTGEAAPAAVGPAPSPYVVAAPVFVNVTFAPTVGAQRDSAVAPQLDAADGPKLIEIGRPAPRHGRLPLIVYGD
jgi:hypothetical protein